MASFAWLAWSSRYASAAFPSCPTNAPTASDARSNAFAPMPRPTPERMFVNLPPERDRVVDRLREAGRVADDVDDDLAGRAYCPPFVSKPASRATRSTDASTSRTMRSRLARIAGYR